MLKKENYRDIVISQLKKKVKRVQHVINNIVRYFLSIVWWLLTMVASQYAEYDII